jgi:hypothetical protein
VGAGHLLILPQVFVIFDCSAIVHSICYEICKSFLTVITSVVEPHHCDAAPAPQHCIFITSVLILQGFVNSGYGTNGIPHVSNFL